jgi:flagellar hook assembly protein FlgD
VIRIYEAEGLTNIDILDGNGQLLRTNDLKEKGDDKTSYVFGGTSEAPSFTVEAKDSHGRRYFYNYFEITRHGFTQLQESDLGGLKQSIRRVFSFNN